MDELLHKWLNGTLNESERKIFESRPDYEFNSRLLKDAAAFKAASFSEPPSFASLEQALSKHKQDKLRFLRPLSRIAAILVIAFGVYFTLFSNGITKVETAFSQQETVELPDQSQVILNAESVLSFSEKDWEQQREVTLDGEAYFIVAKGKRFDVITATGKVSVLGTQFSVTQREGYFEVQCFEGSVAVSQGDSKTQLDPGESYRFLNGVVTEFNTTLNEPAWLGAKSSFQDVPVALVVAELQRQYNININASEQILNRRFSGVFTHDNLQQALSQIAVPLQLNFEINDKDVTLSEKRPQ